MGACRFLHWLPPIPVPENILLQKSTEQDKVKKYDAATHAEFGVLQLLFRAAAVSSLLSSSSLLLFDILPPTIVAVSPRYYNKRSTTTTTTNTNTGGTASDAVAAAADHDDSDDNEVPSALSCNLLFFIFDSTR